MTDSDPARPETDVLPPETGGALSVPPPVPQKKPGFLRRLFMSRKKQQAVAMQNGYLEMVDLIRAIRSHLDRQETVQTSVLAMLEKVPGAMDRQHEVMTMFKQQLENGMENNRRLTDSMGNLNHTLSAMDESQKTSSRTITDLIHRSRESEQLLREVMRRAERRMTALLVFFFLVVVVLGFYFVRGPRRKPAPAQVPAATVVLPVAESAGVAAPVGQPATEDVVPAEPAIEDKAPERPPAPAKKEKPKKKSKAESKHQGKAKPVVVEEAPVGQPDLTLKQLKPTIEEATPPSDKPVSIP